MTITIKITGQLSEDVAPEASGLLRDLTNVEPERSGPHVDSERRRDAGVGIALASLVLSIPGAILATVQLKEHFDRRRLQKRVEALRQKLIDSDVDALFELDGQALDLRRDAVDRILDALTPRD